VEEYDFIWGKSKLGRHKWFYSICKLFFDSYSLQYCNIREKLRLLFLGNFASYYKINIASYGWNTLDDKQMFYGTCV
jgi:hypothetical protein